MTYAELPKIILLTLLFSLAAFAQNFTESHQKIRRAVENKDYANAISELKSLEQTDKKIFAANNYDYLLARMLEKYGDAATATAYYQTVAERDSILREYALWHLAQIFRSSGNLLLERVYLQKISTLAPESLFRDAITKRLPQSFFESRDYETTAKLLENAAKTVNISAPKTTGIKQPSEDRERLVLLGQAYLQTNRANEAKEIFTRLITNVSNPAQPDDYALAAARALDEIVVGKDNFGKTAPTLADTEHFRRANIYQFNRSFDLARLHYQALIKSFPTSNFAPDALYQIGRGFAQERNYDEAINWFERVQAEFPDYPISRDALSQTATAYARVNKPKEALSRYHKFIDQFADAENLDRAYLNIIDVYRDTNANTEALKWAQKTQETFRGKLPEALALFAQAKTHISQNDWQNAVVDLEKLETLPDLGGTRVPGGTNKAEIVFLKAFALENLTRYNEAIDVYLSIPDGRNEYYGWRATERLKALSRDEKTQNFIAQKVAENLRGIESKSAEAQKVSAQFVLRLTENADIRSRMLDVLRKSYAALPDYQKTPNGKILELGRKETLKENRPNVSTNHHQNLADEFLFLGLYDEAAPELETARKTNVETKLKDSAADFNYTLAVFFKRGDSANRAIAYIEPLWRNVPADYEIELIPREQLEMLYPAPYSDLLDKYAIPRQVDARFMLSIMRQESRFRADVKSNAAARGLMQFISTTSDKIAIELSRENFVQDELYNPPTAIEFGAQYLSNIFKIFPNQPAAVAASYNGGEDNMARWLARSKTDNPDRYVAETVFSQSKDYAYKVMASYRVYQMIYDENLKSK